MKLGWKKLSITLACLIAVLPIEAAFGQVRYRSDVVDSKDSKNGAIYGIWGEAQFCPEGTWAAGFEQRVERPQGSGDDTALNSIALYCRYRDGRELSNSVTPHRGWWGSWAKKTCDNGEFLTHFKLKTEKYQVPPFDNTGANAVSFWCGDREIRANNDGQWGTWGEWQGYDKSTNLAICGLSEKMYPYKGTTGDDSALHDVRFYWCRR